MTVSTATIQNATTVSGAVAIVSSSGSTKVLTPASPIAMEVISYSEYIAAFSLTVMIVSFVWGIYAAKKRAKIELAKTDAIERLALAKEAENRAREEANRIERDKLQNQIDNLSN